MAKKTFLQLTNEVGKNTRLSTGSTWSALDTDANQIFIQQAVNIAKQMVENERQWNILQTQITFTSVIGTFTYDLSDLAVVTSDPTVANERTELIETLSGIDLIYDITDATAHRLHRLPRSRVIDLRRLDNGSTTESEPNVCAVYQSGNGLTVEFPYAPSLARNYLLHVYNPEDDLALAATEMTVPWRPVVLAATALVADERGEELGLDASQWWEFYKQALSAAVVSDMIPGVDDTLVAD